MNTNLRKKEKKQKIILKKKKIKLRNDPDFRKTMETVRKHRDFKLVPTEKRTSYLVSE